MNQGRARTRSGGAAAADIEALGRDAEARIAGASALPELEELRVHYLGRKGAPPPS